MRLNIDLMAIPGAEQIEYGGVKGVFIPEAPNYRHFNKRGSIPERAIIAVNLYKTKTRSQKYDHVGQMTIFPEYAEAFLTNPRAVSRHRYVATGTAGTRRTVTRRRLPTHPTSTAFLKTISCIQVIVSSLLLC